MGQKKFDTNINKRREISEKNFSFQIKNTGDVKTTIFMNFLCRKVYWNSCESAFKSFCVGFWLALIGFVPFYTVPFYTPPSVVSSLFANIFHHLSLTEGYKCQFLYFFAKIRNYNFRTNQILFRNYIVIWRVT